MTDLSKPPRIVVIGSINTDMVFKTPTCPEAGETTIGAEFVMVQGGKGANQAVAAARLGAHVAFVGKVGRDSLGDDSLAALASEGIDVEHIGRAEGISSGVASIWVDERSGQNRIVVASGANLALTVADIEAARSVIEAADIVVAQLEVSIDCILAAFRIAHDVSVATILNPAPAQTLPRELLRFTTYATPNEIEAAQIAAFLNSSESTEANPEINALSLLKAGTSNVIVTLGGDGVFFTNGRESFHTSAVKVEQVIDTTAAGDCFTGALAVGLGEGQPVRDAIEFANRAAAIAVGRFGAQPSLPYRGEVE